MLLLHLLLLQLWLCLFPPLPSLLPPLSRPPKPYKQKFVGMLVPFGATGGTGSMNGWTVPQFAVVKLKSGDLFTKQFWTTMGLRSKIPQV